MPTTRTLMSMVERAHKRLFQLSRMSRVKAQPQPRPKLAFSPHSHIIWPHTQWQWIRLLPVTACNVIRKNLFLFCSLLWFFFCFLCVTRSMAALLCAVRCSVPLSGSSTIFTQSIWYSFRISSEHKMLYVKKAERIESEWCSIAQWTIAIALDGIKLLPYIYRRRHRVWVVFVLCYAEIFSLSIFSPPTYRADCAEWIPHVSDRHSCRFSVQSWKVVWLLQRSCSPLRYHGGAMVAIFQVELAQAAAPTRCLATSTKEGTKEERVYRRKANNAVENCEICWCKQFSLNSFSSAAVWAEPCIVWLWFESLTAAAAATDIKLILSITDCCSGVVCVVAVNVRVVRNGLCEESMRGKDSVWNVWNVRANEWVKIFHFSVDTHDNLMVTISNFACSTAGVSEWLDSSSSTSALLDWWDEWELKECAPL